MTPRNRKLHKSLGRRATLEASSRNAGTLSIPLKPIMLYDLSQVFYRVFYLRDAMFVIVYFYFELLRKDRIRFRRLIPGSSREDERQQGKIFQYSP